MAPQLSLPYQTSPFTNHFLRQVTTLVLTVFVASAWVKGGDLVGPNNDDFDRELGTVGDELRSLDFELFRPPGHTASELPLTIFLHGLSDGQAFKQMRLNDTMRGLVHATQRDNITRGVCGVDMNFDSPCEAFDDRYASYLLVPKIRDGASWSGYVPLVGELMREVQRDYRVDPQRIYLLGYSDGGSATVNVLSLRTDFFAAGVPISGGATPSSNTVPVFQDVPLWFFHGSSDPVVPPTSSTRFVEALEAAGSEPKLTLVPGGHNAGYEAAFNDPETELFDWLFGQSREVRNNTLAPINTYAVRDLAINGVTDSIGDVSHDVMFSFPSVAVGSTDTTRSNYVDRLITKFELPRDESSETLESATLRIYSRSTRGNPIGPLSLFHSATDNRLYRAASDFEDATYVDSFLDVRRLNDENRQFFEVDVTRLVRADYKVDTDTPMSAFRLQIDELVFMDDGVSNSFLISPSGLNRPELILRFVPEPSCLPAVVVTLLFFGIRAARLNIAYECNRQRLVRTEQT